MDHRDDDERSLAELSALADDLLAQASQIRRQWTELAGALGVELPEETDPYGAQARTVTRGDADPARLVALDMMLSGRSRDEVEAHLRATFGDEAALGPVLDEVFSDVG